MSKKSPAKNNLDQIGIDAICQKIIDCVSYRDIAEEAGVSIGTLHSWISGNPEHSARVREARTITAKQWDEKAEQEIRAASDQFELNKAKELAHHYRWRSAKIAPREYGEKLELSGDAENPIAVTAIERTIVKAGNPNS